MQKLFEALTSQKLNISDIRQAEAGQKRKLDEILKKVDTWLEIDIAGEFNKTDNVPIILDFIEIFRWNFEMVNGINPFKKLCCDIAFISRIGNQIQSKYSTTRACFNDSFCHEERK